jgi:3-phosphoshikimate 1-carboxyvinyltransferase
MERPMDVYQEIFKRQKCLFKQKHGQIVIKGKLKPDRFEVRGDISSQFITGLLFGLSLLDNYSSIVVVTPLESKPYVDLTT